ncbi:MAG: hypothetical protein JW915_24100 [Chitinispirillaceae bacterium]|nr:hypothetical protein [Chitinispirillaceae bacterium]
MIFDKNAERIKALQKKLKTFQGDPERIRRRMKRLVDAGPEYWADWYDRTGTRRREKPSKNTRQAAEKLERQRRTEVSHGMFDCPDDRRVTLETVVNYFIEYKNNSPDTRTIGKKITEHIGKLTLDKCDRNPVLLVDHFKRFPEKDWSPKYQWNYYLKLRAAIQFWITMHRMQMVNPCKVIPALVSTLRPITNIREVRPSLSDFNRLIVACVECKAPQELMDLFTAVKESGLRIGEVLRWQCEHFKLVVGKNDQGEIVELPYYRTAITKRGIPVVQELPMRRALYDLMVRVIGGRPSGPVWSWKNPPYKLIKNLGIMNQAELKNLRPFHDYRKTFKTEVKLAGATPEISMYLQGHATQSMDEYYTQFRRTDAQALFTREYSDL